MLEVNEVVRLRDYLFSPPSPYTLARVMAENQLNGRIIWKNKNGKTLDEIERNS